MSGVIKNSMNMLMVVEISLFRLFTFLNVLGQAYIKIGVSNLNFDIIIIISSL